MKTYSVVIDLMMPDDASNSMFTGLDVAFADAVFNAGGEVLNISDYIDITEDNYYGEVD